MKSQVIGISGSPIKNSNTDRLIQEVLISSGLPSEIVKLNEISVRPCIACLGCKKDNIFKVKDDSPELAEKVREAGAIVVSGYSSYESIDGFTKSFIERLFSDNKQIVIAIALGYPNWAFPANRLETSRESVDSITTWFGFN